MHLNTNSDKLNSSVVNEVVQFLAHFC